MILLAASLRTSPQRMDANTLPRSRGGLWPKYDQKELKHNEEFISGIN
jgi:hypothetical protein